MDYIRQELLRQQHILTTLLFGLQTSPDSTEPPSSDTPTSLRFSARSKSPSLLQPSSKTIPYSPHFSLSNNSANSLSQFSANLSNYPFFSLIPISSPSFDASLTYPLIDSTTSTNFTSLTNSAYLSNFTNPSIDLTNSLSPNPSLDFLNSYQSFQKPPLNLINPLNIFTLFPTLSNPNLDNTRASSDFVALSNNIYASYTAPTSSPDSNPLPVYPLINSTQHLHNSSPLYAQSYAQFDLLSKTHETLDLFDSPDSISNSKDLQSIRNSLSSPLMLDQKTPRQNLDLNDLSLQTSQDTQIFHITPNTIPNSIPDFIPSSISNFIQNTSPDPLDTDLNTAAFSKQNQSKTTQSQSHIITEWTEIQDTPSVSPQTFSRAFQRDARRYDGGFNIF